MRLIELYKKNKRKNREIIDVDYHMNLLYQDLDYLKNSIPELNGMSEEETLDYFDSIYRKCNSSNPEYDSKLDENMIRIGLRTNEFYSYHDNLSNGAFADSGVGDTPSSLYDDFIDAQNDDLLRR